MAMPFITERRITIRYLLIEREEEKDNEPEKYHPFYCSQTYVIRRTGEKNLNAVSHNRGRPYFRIQHGRGEVRSCRVYLNVHSVVRVRVRVRKCGGHVMIC